MTLDSVAKALTWGQTQLGNSSSASLDSEMLLAKVLGKNKTWLRTWPDNLLSSEQQTVFQDYIKRRSNGEPVAYIVGSKGFWTFELMVNSDTLVPRPETEILVQAALDKIPLKAKAIQNDCFKVADLGTGTGAIALAIASERPQATVYAVDFSHGALAVAEHNREQLGFNNLIIEQRDWLKQWPHGKLDLIVSNPPYVEPDDPHLAGLSFEPITALVAEDQGLADIRMITKQASQSLNTAGWLLFEHGFEQAEAVRSILQAHGFVAIETIKDWSGLPRVTLGQLVS